MIIPSIPVQNGKPVLQAGAGELAAAAKKFSVVPTFHIDVKDGESLAQVKDTLRVYPGRVLVSAKCDTAEAILDLLDSYAGVVVVPYVAGVEQALEQLPKERLGVSLTAQQLKDVGADVAKLAGTLVVVVDGQGSDIDTAAAAATSKLGRVVVQWNGPPPTAADVAALDKKGLDVLIGTPLLSGQLDLGDAVAAPLVSDREDGLFPTVVVDEQGVALGLVYSSKESIRESIKTGRGVYQSRKRGLWYKGDSSGAIQYLLSVELDCDRDALKMVVHQHGAGFCHLETRSCFGAPFGIPALMRLLRQRKEVPVEKSYTQRLFKDPALLHSKILEEAQELCDAEDPEEIAWEAADVIYFALTKCAAAGVGLEEVERQLGQRQMKVTRRPGNAKPPAVPPPSTPTVNGTAAPAPAPTPAPQTPTQTPPAPEIPATVCLTKYDYTKCTPDVRERLCKRPAQMDSAVINQRTHAILDDVRKRGDAALLDYTERFDKAKLSSPVVTLPLAQPPVLDAKVKAAIDQAFGNIHTFHKAQVPSQPLVVETQPGITCSRVVRPIEKVGLYVPGGTAVLPSTALMLGIPAMVAGCKEIVVASPPRADGSLAPEILYIAEKIGASKILLAGGAQAIGAMAFGTESVPKVDKICGPGNAYVTAAKMVVQNDSSCPVAIDMPAGPSEVLVICDGSADPEFVAIDLLSQAEHGVDSQVVLVAVAMDEHQLGKIDSELERLTKVLPRETIIRESLSKSYAVTVASLEEAMTFSNQYGPEHLIVNVVEPRRALDLLTCAGSVFVGPYSPESCGDYASGTNHTLPTYGYARMYSGVSTSTFLNHITVQELTPEGLQGIGECVTTLAALEKLDAHRNAVVLRLNKLNASK